MNSRSDFAQRPTEGFLYSNLRRLALPLACVLFVVLGALATFLLPTTSEKTVQVDSNGVVISVEAGSEAWDHGVRPGWTIVAEFPGETAYGDGQSVRPITDDLAKRAPGQILVPSLVFLALAVAAYPIGLRRTSTTLAVVAAALVDGAFVPRLGLVGSVASGIPIVLAGFFVGQISQMAGLAGGFVWRAASWVLFPVGVVAVAWGLGGILAAVEFAAYSYLAIAWLIVVRWRIANATPASGATSRLAIARAVALETVPFVSRVRRTGAQAERDRLASDLHAEVLPAIASRAEELERRGDSASAEVLRDLAHEVRDLVSARRLPILEDEGLVDAAEWLAESLESRATVQIEIDLAGDSGTRPPLTVERAAYRVLQLALDNVIRHAAASTAVVGIAGGGRTLTMVVSDDGQGFEPAAAANAKRRGRLGMSDMRSEAEGVGARLVFGEPAVGTTVTFRWQA